MGRYARGLWCPSGAGTLGTVRGGHGQGHGGVRVRKVRSNGTSTREQGARSGVVRADGAKRLVPFA